MIVGNGMLARAFRSYEGDQRVVLFASGVSNSLETDEREFLREQQLLCSVINAHPRAQLVYFSTCSIADPDRFDTPYVKHKLRMEQLLAKTSDSWLVLRLPAVIGHCNAARTFPFYVRDRIVNDESFKVWEKAIRYPIDVRDVVQLSRCLIGKPEYECRVIDLALRAYLAVEIVEAVEMILGLPAKKIVMPDAGMAYELNLETAHTLARKLGIVFDEHYLSRVLHHYFGDAQHESSNHVQQSQT